MDFTMNMMDTGRGITSAQAAAVAAMGGQIAYPGHTIGVQHGGGRMHDGGEMMENKVHDMVKGDDSQGGAFTPPPPRSASHDSRVEKGTDTNDFEPPIKVELRGTVPGLATGAGGEKDKHSVVQLHFNSVNEVLHYFGQRSTSVPPQHLEAFNLLASTNPELVRNINPGDLVRNHFLYVPTTGSSNGYGGAQALGTTQATQVVKQSGYRQDKRRSGGGGGESSSQSLVSLPLGTPTILARQPLVVESCGGSSGTSFVCWMCGVDLGKSLAFEEHMADAHSVEKPYRCDDCGVVFKRKAHLDRHRRIHLPVKPYQCGDCGKGFTRGEHVRRHSFTHSGEKPYLCPTPGCARQFSRREHLAKHLVSHAAKGGAPGAGVGGPHSPSPGGPPSAPGLATTLLLQTTDQNGRLVTINQVPAVSQDGGGGHRGAGQDGGGGGRGHARGHNANGEPVARPYQCGVCGKAFIRNEHLRRHVLTHSGEKPHACAVCGKAFSRREHLTKHMRSHNKGTLTPSGAQASHNSLQQGGSNLVTAQGTLSGSLPPGTIVAATSAHQQGHTQTVSASHASVAHPAHLPPGTHYLPMFGLLAEVV